MEKLSKSYISLSKRQKRRRLLKSDNSLLKPKPAEVETILSEIQEVVQLDCSLEEENFVDLCEKTEKRECFEDICSSLRVDNATDNKNTTATTIFKNVENNYKMDGWNYEINDTSEDTNEVVLDIKNDIRLWATSNYISRKHINELLIILRKHGHKDLSTDSRSLFRTPRTHKNEIIKVKPGKYFHFGISTRLIKSANKYFTSETCPTELKVNIGIDGLPLVKSSGSTLWPILMAIDAEFYTQPFLVGVYHGLKKPQNCNTFLKPFVDDFSNITNSKLKIFEKEVSLVIKVFICDAPAKAFIAAIKGHNAYFGCGKCTQKGFYISNRTTFPEVNAQLRTDESFRQKLQPIHHNKKSILKDLNIGMVSQVASDYMHIVCLGVMKKLLLIFTKGKQLLDKRLEDEKITELSNKLISCVPFISTEFARKPRNLDEVKRFKATEFRQILLYTGLVIFKNVLPEEKYNHFVCLSVAMRILCSVELHLLLNSYAKDLLKYFVIYFSKIYGKHNMSYNVHNLIHLSDEVKMRGPLDKFSAFKFENMMQSIKKKLKLAVIH